MTTRSVLPAKGIHPASLDLDTDPGIDYRLPQHRPKMFLLSWEFSLMHGTFPGCVYHWLPWIADACGLDDDRRAWLAWLNGNTQNAVTSLMLLDASGGSATGWQGAVDFWNRRFADLEWDTDRRHQKGKFGEATAAFIDRVGTAHPAEEWLAAAAGGWPAMWAWATSLPYMGRLSSWSMIEFSRILLGPRIPDADTLMLGDASGSNSHRNGLAVVSGCDAAYWTWADTRDRVPDLDRLGEQLLAQMQAARPQDPAVARLTLESALCTYKSWHKPNRRYPNVYADMAYNRLRRAEARFGHRFSLLWEGRRRALPRWARLEDNPLDPGLSPVKQNHYRETGQPVMLGHVWPELWSDFDTAVAEGRFGIRKDVTP